MRWRPRSIADVHGETGATVTVQGFLHLEGRLQSLALQTFGHLPRCLVAFSRHCDSARSHDAGRRVCGKSAIRVGANRPKFISRTQTSTTDGPGRLFPPKPVARTARTACQRANSVRLRNIVKHLWKHAFERHFMIETKGCVERTNPRVFGCRQSAFGAATAVRSCVDSAFNWFRAFSCCSRIVWGKSLSVVKKEPARIVTFSTCFSSASAFPRTSCVAFIRIVRLGHSCLVALLVVDEPRIFLARAGPRASVAS